ncbi:hypothetical protein FRB98_002833 [Tulasnella sp. 332]|nr:hypothetical protein FRB98_002833 [Tulasnella sp. 332]
MNPKAVPSVVSQTCTGETRTELSSTIPDDGSIHPHQQSSEETKQASDPVSTERKIEQEIVKTPVVMLTTSFQRRTHDFRVIPIPRKQQYNPSETFNLTLTLNIVFGICSTSITANLYYFNLAHSFNTTDSAVSTIPTVTQAGYAVGILLISPLGDLVRRRPLILFMLSLSLLFTIGIALAPSVPAFKALSFLTGVCTVTPQILIPYAVDLAPRHRQGSVMSIVLAGLILGVIVARAIGGVVADVSGSWRNVYWMGGGLQGLSLLSLWWVVPDRPSKTEWEMEPALEGRDSRLTSAATVGGAGLAHPPPRLTYLGILRTMLKFAVTEPILVQSCIIGLLSQAIFASFWITLTFLLTGPPYHYTTLSAPKRLVGVATAPFVGRLVDKLVLWVGMLVAICILSISTVILTVGSGLNIAAVVIVCLGLDMGLQLGQVSTTSKIYQYLTHLALMSPLVCHLLTSLHLLRIDPAYRSRLNAVYVVAIFSGQLVGSAVGSKIYLSSGWRASAGASIGFSGLMLIVMLMRGPHCKRYTWFGWEGGARFAKDTPTVVRDEENKIDPDVEGQFGKADDTGHR